MGLAYSGWRKWVLGSWKIPTENAEAIFPRLQETVTRFGPPCAIMRDLGPAMRDAAEQLVKTLDHPIPILACHQHFLSDIGTDLLQESHDKLRNLFRQMHVRKDLHLSLRQRRPERGSAKDMRQAIDIILTHLDRHGEFLWGRPIPIPEQLGGGVRLVDRTNNIDEGLFHTLKHGERRRSGCKNLAQDLERLPPGTLLAFNLTRPDYVEIVCGNIDRLLQLFAGLDGPDRRCSLAVARLQRTGESAFLNSTDRRLVRMGEMEPRILAAAMS